jgi:hypothetical protein
VGLGGLFAIPGVAWATGLIGLAAAALMRFSRRLVVTIPSMVALILLLSFYQTAWTRNLQVNGAVLPEGLLIKTLDIVLLNGKLVVPLVLAALVAFQVLEARWAKRCLKEPVEPLGAGLGGDIAAWVDRWTGRARALASRDAAYAAGESRRTLEAQLAIGRAEVTRLVKRNALFERNRLIELKLEGAAVEPASSVRSSPQAWLDVRIALGALALIMLVLPRLPADWAKILWAFPFLNFTIPGLDRTIAQYVLIAVLLAIFVLRPAFPSKEAAPDARVRYGAETGMAYAAMGAALLSLFAVPMANYYPPFSSIVLLDRPYPLDLGETQIPVVMMLIAVAVAGGLTRSPALVWRRTASINDKRAALIHNVLILVDALILMWLSIKIYVGVLAALHAALGDLVFNTFGQAGNVVTAVVCSIVMFVIAIAVGVALRAATQRLETALVDMFSQETKGARQAAE